MTGQEPGLPHQHGPCLGYHLSELCSRVSQGCPEFQGLPVCCCTGSDEVNAGAAIRAVCQGLSPAQHSCGAWGDVLPNSPVPFAQHTRTVFQHSLYNKLQLEDSTHWGWEQLALILTCACFLFLLLYQGSHDSGVHPLLLCSRDEPSLVPSHPFPKPRHNSPLTASGCSSLNESYFLFSAPSPAFPKGHFQTVGTSWLWWRVKAPWRGLLVLGLWHSLGSFFAFSSVLLGCISQSVCIFWQTLLFSDFKESFSTLVKELN